jgi:pimeloyl-ACP methyl ester carboxylesterase
MFSFFSLFSFLGCSPQGGFDAAPNTLGSHPAPAGSKDGHTTAKVAPPRAQVLRDTRYHHYKSETNKPTVVYIHGNLGSSFDLLESGLPELLSGKFSYLVYDRPGFGASRRNRSCSAYSPRDFALHLRKLLLELKIEKPILVGHSWGGSVALAYALEFQDDVHSMALLAPAANPWPGLFATSPALWIPLVPVLGDLYLHTAVPSFGRLLAPYSLDKVFHPADVPENYAKQTIRYALRPSTYRFAAHDTIMLRDALKEQSKHYGKIALGTIVLSDENDTIVPPVIHAKPLVERLQNAKYWPLSEAGHHLIFSKPEVVFEALQRLALGGSHDQ